MEWNEEYDIIKATPSYRYRELADDSSYLGDALDMVVAALQKQIPKPADYRVNDMGIFGKMISRKCPICGFALRYREEYDEPIDKWCSNCGQAIDWSE